MFLIEKTFFFLQWTQNLPTLRTVHSEVLTSDAMKIKVNTVVIQYCVYFDFQCIRRYISADINIRSLDNLGSHLNKMCMTALLCSTVELGMVLEKSYHM